MTLRSDVSSFIGDRFNSLAPDQALALIFPGQGSQKPGMGADVVKSSAIAAQVMEIADETLGQSLSRLCFIGPEEDLTLTANAQPAILAVSIAILCAALESGTIGKRPAIVAGHSLGEYTALVASGALVFEEALLLVRERGRLMERAGEDTAGTMAAIVGLSESDVAEICRASGAEACNYNSPSQVVVGGTAPAVAAACKLAKEKGGRGLPLNVAGAFHTSLMEPAAREFAVVLNGYSLKDPAFQLVGNVTGTILMESGDIVTELAEQIARPVRWSQSLSLMIEKGIRRVIEAGPGRTLTAVIKRSYPELQVTALDGVAAVHSPSNV